MEDLARVRALGHEIGVGGLDVGDDEQALGRAGRRGRQADAELDGAVGTRRVELDDPERRIAEVGVEPPPELRVEGFGPVDIRHGDHDGLELRLDAPGGHVNRLAAREFRLVIDASGSRLARPLRCEPALVKCR